MSPPPFWATQAEIPRRYRFIEYPYLPEADSVVIATIANDEWSGPPPELRPDDELVVLVRPDAPDEVVAAIVTSLRALGHTVVERQPSTGVPREE